jgi:uncharacterized protein YggT (Ycf19 family)
MDFRDSPNEQRVKERATRTQVVDPEAGVATEEVVTATSVEPSKDEKRSRGLFRAELIVWYILGVIEVFLGIRLVLALLNATGTINNSSGFAQFVYEVADPLTKPFYGLFNTAQNGAPGIGVVITAMVIYGLIGFGISRLLRLGRS